MAIEYKCPAEGCGAKFPTERGLNYHTSRVHGYYCQGCGKLFSSRMQLSNHMRGTHVGGEKSGA